MLHTSGSSVVRTASVESQEAFKEANTAPDCLTIQNPGVRLALLEDLEYLLEDDGLKHINTQIQRRSERQETTPEFKDSNLRPGSMMKTETRSTPGRRLQDATLVWLDGRQNQNLNGIDATRCELVGP